MKSCPRGSRTTASCYRHIRRRSTAASRPGRSRRKRWLSWTITVRGSQTQTQGGGARGGGEEREEAMAFVDYYRPGEPYPNERSVLAVGLTVPANGREYGLEDAFVAREMHGGGREVGGGGRKE